MTNSKEIQISVNNKWIQNLKNVMVPVTINYSLSLGSKFSYPNTHLPTFNIIASVEKGISQTENNKENINGGKISNISTKTKNKLKHFKKIQIFLFNFL